MQCASCQNVKRGKSERLNQWLDDRGLCYCGELKKVTSLSNYKGVACAGKLYRAIEKTELF